MKCIICQKNAGETLQCPADLRRSDVEVGAGYKVFISNLERFIELNDLPTNVDVSLLDDGTGMFQTLIKNRAKWHISCRNRSLD